MNKSSVHRPDLELTGVVSESHFRNRLIEILEAERGQIAREIHDQAGQLLVSAAFRLDQALAMLPRGFVARELVQEARQVLDECGDELRRVAFNLRPRMLDDLGLLPALRSYLRQYARLGDVELESELAEPPEKLDPDTELAIFRIFQEAITNVRKHSLATRVQVRLGFTPGQALLEVCDNGVGFDPNATGHKHRARPAMGLAGMRERAAALGGEVEVAARPSAGTTIRARLPINRRDTI